MTRNLRILTTVVVCLLSGPRRLPSSSTGLSVRAGGDFQAALNYASPGDTITLEAGATFVGHFVLPKKVGSDYITITSSDQAGLPAPGTRIKPPDAPHLPKLVSPDAAPALTTAAGAHHYRLVGIEIHPGKVYSFGLLELGDALATSVADLAHHLIVDRVYVHGDPALGAKRGIALNSASTTIENSYISDIKSTSQDSQAICSWNGPGPFTIVNNYLEASGENVMFGGMAPGIPSLIPADITMRRNYFYKPLSWKVGEPNFQGTSDPSSPGAPWVVKNLFEIKSARRVLVEGNIFENCWVMGQNGWGLVLTPRLSGGLTAVVSNVTFRNNIIRHVGGGANILGKDDTAGNQGQTDTVIFNNNLFDDVNSKLGPGYLFQILNGAKNITVEHVTSLNDATLLLIDELPSQGLIYRNNISSLGGYGIHNPNGGGTAGLNAGFPGPSWVFAGNVLPGWIDPATGKQKYPPHPTGNFYPVGVDDVGWVDRAHGGYQLAAGSPYKGKASDGKDPGVDMAALTAATSNVITGAAPVPQRGVFRSADTGAR